MHVAGRKHLSGTGGIPAFLRFHVGTRVQLHAKGLSNARATAQKSRRYQQQLTGREAVKLPSTSPANAAWSAERLTAAWRVILEALK